MLANLDADQAKNTEAYGQVVKGAVGALKAALSGVGQEAASLGTAEQRLMQTRLRHDEVANQIEQQLATVEDVDIAEAITRAQAMQTQLEASYRCLSMLSGLSLTKFLS